MFSDPTRPVSRSTSERSWCSDDLLLRAQHGRRHALRDEAQRLDDVRVQDAGQLRRRPGQRAHHPSPDGNRDGDVGPDGDAVRGVQTAASIGRQIGGHAGEHERLALKKLLRAPRHGVELVDTRPATCPARAEACTTSNVFPPGAQTLRLAHSMSRRLTSLTQRVVENGPDLIRLKAKKGR